MHVVSTGVVLSACVEVWQSGHGALEVILLHTAANSTIYPATRDDDGVLKLDGAGTTEIIIIMTPILTLMTLYSHCMVWQTKAGCGAGVGGRQDFRAVATVQINIPMSPDQKEASRGSPAGVVLPPLPELVTLLPAPASQSDASGEGSSIVSTARHQPVLGVATPVGGERRHCAGEGDT